MAFAQKYHKYENKHIEQVYVTSVIFLGPFLGPLAKVAVFLLFYCFLLLNVLKNIVMQPKTVQNNKNTS